MFDLINRLQNHGQKDIYILIESRDVCDLFITNEQFEDTQLIFGGGGVASSAVEKRAPKLETLFNTAYW